MEYGEHIDAIRREGDALVRAARQAGVDAAVPACDGWTIADLLSHIGRIHHWVAEIVEGRPADPTRHWSKTVAPEGDALIAYEDEGFRRLAGALEAAGPDETAWTWTPFRTTRFWARRQAHELAVHRWDAQGALGTSEPVERELAVDGIQEVFDILPFRPNYTPVAGTGETIHLHCTDGEGEWLMRIDVDGLHVTREHAKGDCAARGSASDLLLLVWGRIGADAVETFGDASLLERWNDAKF